VRLFGRNIAPADLALALAGVLGAVCFFWMLPAQHPGSTADHSLGAEEAEARARRFMERSGFAPPDEASNMVYVRNNGTILDGLQAEAGRPQTVDLLEGPANARLPAFHWRVRWHTGSETNDYEDQGLHVLLNHDGVPYALKSNDANDWFRPEGAVDRGALRAALARDRSGGSDAPSAAQPDSSLHSLFSFDFAPVVQQGGTAAPSSATGTLAPRSDSAAGLDRTLDRAAAVRMTRHHLSRTALEGYTFRLDTLYTSRIGGVETATARFWGSAFHGQRPRVDVEVTAAGTLVRLDTRFNHDGLPGRLADTSARSLFYRSPDALDAKDESEDNVSIQIGDSDTGAGIVTSLLYVLLVIGTIFLFIRRLSARVVDVNSALRDGLWGGIFASGMVTMMLSLAFFKDASFWIAVLIIGTTFVFTFAGGAFVIFLASGAMDSLARAEWPEKVAALTLLRHGAVRNVPVGAALLRGVGGAFALLGTITLLLMLFPQAALDFTAGSDAPPPPLLLSRFGFLFGAAAWMAQFVGLTVLLGVGTWLHRRKPAAWFVVPCLAVALVLMQVGIAKMDPLGFHALFLAAAGLGTAWVFWRYDFVAAFMMIVLASVLWGTADGWMVAATPAVLDAGLALGTTALVGLVGGVGLVSGRTSTLVPSYVPSYITELAEQQRLQRDIEIAEEVQRSFLPRRMPRVEGLDLAALCLPAREVGGDYYDFVELPGGRLGVVVGDVSGKGIEASFYMTLAKGYFQTLAEEDASPAEVLRRLNGLFRRNAPGGTFITMIYGVIDPSEGTFCFARAGHNPLVHRRTTGGEAATGNGLADAAEAHQLQPGGMAIGLADGTHFDGALDEVTLPFHPGDALVLYTDGFPEARTTEGEEFGEERIRARIERHGDRPAQQLLQTLADDVHSFVEAAGRHDDMTMVVVKRAGEIQEEGSAGTRAAASRENVGSGS
jgi:serine phosphatase RsbU (regulator of sigma subunit)